MDNKHNPQQCSEIIRGVHDAMDILKGKWKISIIATLCYEQKRYTDILNQIKGISGKMLSRELKDLEVNQLVRRSVQETQPVTVLYALTPYGQKLKAMIESLAIWGIEHRRKIMNTSRAERKEERLSGVEV